MSDARSFDKGINRQLLFSLPMREGTGAVSTQDMAKPHHPVLQTHAPVWTQLASGIWVLDFDGANDYLSCLAASCTDLDFTAGDFSGCVWVYLDSLAANVSFITRGVAAASGWIFDGLTTGVVQFKSCQGGAATQTTSTAAAAIATGAWRLIGWGRSGAGARVVIDGIDVTSVAGVHVDPLTSAANLQVGALAGADFMNGKMWNPRIWGRALSPQEHMSIFQRERHWFGV